jgi:hypothetical protein
MEVHRGKKYGAERINRQRRRHPKCHFVWQNHPHFHVFRGWVDCSLSSEAAESAPICSSFYSPA